MSRRRRVHHHPGHPTALRSGPRPGVALLVTLAIVAAFGYMAFVRTVPFTRSFQINALLGHSEGLLQDAPVREDGVDVGHVTGLAPGPDHTARVTMQIDDQGLPVHADTVLRVRPRVFLEGGFYIDLSPGTPAAPILHSGATIPQRQTSVAVQADQVFSAFPSNIRASTATVFHELSSSLRYGGADAWRTIAQELPNTFKQGAIAAQAFQGTTPGDLAHLIASASAVDATLASQRPALHGLIVDGERTWRVLGAHAPDLQSTIRSFDALLTDLPPTLASVNAALPPTRTFLDAAHPAFDLLPRSFTASVTALGDLQALTQPQRLPRLLTLLQPPLRALPTFESGVLPLLNLTRSVSDCVTSAIVPVLNSKLDDGNLSTHRPVWQDLLHAAVGNASAAQNFDGNGGYVRFEGGSSDQYVTFGDIPGLGPALGTSGLPLLGVRPHWNGETPPPLRPDAPCSSQGLPSLQVAPWHAESSFPIPSAALLSPARSAELLHGLLRARRQPTGAHGARR